MELVILFWVGLTTGLSGAMIPGPVFLYTVSEAFRDGRRAGLKIALGHLLIEAVFVWLIVAGLRELLAASVFRLTVAWVGGIGLVAMGVFLLRRVPRLTMPTAAQMTFHHGPVLGGAFFSLVSPGFLLWWATIGAAVFLQGTLRGLLGIGLLSAGHALADLVWHWLVAYSVERGRPFCRDQTYRLVMGGIAVCLVVFGVGLPVKHLLWG